MDLNIIIPAVVAAVGVVLAAALNRVSQEPVVLTEAEHEEDDRARLIESLSEALIHCLREHGGVA